VLKDNHILTDPMMGIWPIQTIFPEKTISQGSSLLYYLWFVALDATGFRVAIAI